MLNQIQQGSFLALALACAEPTLTEDQTTELLTTYVRPLIPFRDAFAAIVRIGANAHSVEHLITVRNDNTLSKSIRSTRILEELSKFWLIRQEPVSIASFEERARPIAPAPGPERMMVIHGQMDTTMRVATLFYFDGSLGAFDHVTIFWLRLAVPHLHSVMCRFYRNSAQCDARFSEAEAQVITCLLAGRSNKQIAYELGKREATVRNQLHSIFRKLNVNSRSRAIHELVGSGVSRNSSCIGEPEALRRCVNVSGDQARW